MEEDRFDAEDGRGQPGEESVENLEVVRGNVRNLIAVRTLEASLLASGITGTLYLGYPVIATADDTVTLEALLITPTFGAIGFTFPDADVNLEKAIDTQDRLSFVIENNLRNHESLRSGRALSVPVKVVSFFPSDDSVPEAPPDGYYFAGPSSVFEVAVGGDGLSLPTYRALGAAVQRVTMIKAVKKRENAIREGSLGWKMKQIEKEIANLDRWQKKAAIEVPAGPQRVRGLAGSGKTVVLALKAAYLHTQYPTWNIAVTFYTRSLAQQFKDLIERFTFEHSGNRPDWSRLRVLHAWGSASEPGVYSVMAETSGVEPVSYAAAKARYGPGGEFSGICAELFSVMRRQPDKSVFDAVLIDEAQDLPTAFFRCVYRSTKDPKRVVWAYDELQNLSNAAMPPTSELFGVDEHGTPLVTVENVEGEAQRDIVLPVCYRNTPWALTVAHSLGFGTCRTEIVQLFNNLSLFEEIGYRKERGELAFGQRVCLSRRTDSFPAYFDTYLSPEDSVTDHLFESVTDQYEWIADQIEQNITRDELEPDDVLIVLPEAVSSREHFAYVSEALARRSIACHLAGVSTDRDVFSVTGSVTVASIYRAKGNEAPMVYIANSQACAVGQEMIKLRNTLFTAITRSRAWVRVCGVGEQMRLLHQEIQCVRSAGYKLDFVIPTPEQLEANRRIYRDRTEEERGQLTRAVAEMKKIQRLVEEGVLNPTTSPELKSLVDFIRQYAPENGER